MKRTIAFFSIAAALFLSYSCGETENKAGSPAAVSFSENAISAPYAGGRYSVGYVLSGGSTDTALPEVSCEADWINDIQVGKTAIEFDVSANPELQERTAEIVVRYAGRELENRLAVRQDAYVPGDGMFDVEITSVTGTGIVFSVIPEDKEMTWYCGICDKAGMDSYASEQEFVAALLEEIRETAGGQGVGIEEYLDGKLRYGNLTSGSFDNLEPDSDLYLYVLGMTREGVCLTGVSKKSFHTEAPMTFDISYEIDKASVTAIIVPSVKDRYYVCDAMKTSDYLTYTDAQSFKDTYQEALNFLISFSGKSPEEYVRTNCHMGDCRISDWELTAATDYTGYVFEISATGELLSFATTKEFTTGNVEMSDNTFEISISDITEDSAVCHVTTTTDDPYILGWSQAAGWEGKSENEIRDDIIGWGYTGYYISAAGSDEFPLSGILEPETEYIVFAFGYEGGLATTDLVKVHFTTGKPVVSDVVFEAEYGKYYDGDALLELYPRDFIGASGKAVLPFRAKATPVEEVGTFMYHIILGDCTDESTMSDAAVRSYLEFQGLKQESAAFYLDYDVVYTIIGVAKDKNGVYGKVYRQRIVLTRDGVSPVTEYQP